MFEINALLRQFFGPCFIAFEKVREAQPVGAHTECCFTVTLVALHVLAVRADVMGQSCDGFGLLCRDDLANYVARLKAEHGKMADFWSRVAG